MSEKRKLVATIAGVETVVCLLLSSWYFAGTQYYRGRLDAKKEADKEINKLKKELEKKNKRFYKKFGL